MAVTAKQIADQLGISAAAVSLALNNRRGVSEKTRQLVLSTAEALGYDFSKIKFERQRSGTVALVAFNRRRIFATPSSLTCSPESRAPLGMRDSRFRW